MESGGMKLSKNFYIPTSEFITSHKILPIVADFCDLILWSVWFYTQKHLETLDAFTEVLS